MTATTNRVDHPGSTMTAAGLGLALLGLVLFIIGVNGPIAMWALLALFAGLVLASVGFARRVLAALEKRENR